MYYAADFLVCISIGPRNNVCGACEFSVKVGLFSETSREITHFFRELRWSLIIMLDNCITTPVCLIVSVCHKSFCRNGYTE